MCGSDRSQHNYGRLATVPLFQHYIEQSSRPCTISGDIPITAQDLSFYDSHMAVIGFLSSYISPLLLALAVLHHYKNHLFFIIIYTILCTKKSKQDGICKSGGTAAARQIIN